jgi:hypothetical protein
MSSESHKDIINFCYKNNINFEANVIKNAVLLNKEIVKSFKK